MIENEIGLTPKTLQFLDFMNKTFDECGLLRRDAARIMGHHEQSIRRWSLKQMGFKNKESAKRFVQRVKILADLRRQGVLPVHTTLTADDRAEYIFKIVKPYLQ